MTHISTSIVAWRREQLTRVGYSEQEASTLAEQDDIDLHLAVDLVSRGCAPSLALRILL